MGQVKAVSLKGLRKDLIQEWHGCCIAEAIRKREHSWYFQRYVPHLPAGGEIVLLIDPGTTELGWKVMGFATEKEVEEFFRDVVEFERMLVRSGIILLKYWFSISDEEQQFRFQMRIEDP